MSRVPGHTAEDAPEAPRALLEGVIQFSSTGKPLNLHVQMARSPSMLFRDPGGHLFNVFSRTHSE
jgi:hypothetical protein